MYILKKKNIQFLQNDKFFGQIWNTMCVLCCLLYLINEPRNSIESNSINWSMARTITKENPVWISNATQIYLNEIRREEKKRTTKRERKSIKKSLFIMTIGIGKSQTTITKRIWYWFGFHCTKQSQNKSAIACGVEHSIKWDLLQNKNISARDYDEDGRFSNHYTFHNDKPIAKYSLSLCDAREEKEK